MSSKGSKKGSDNESYDSDDSRLAIKKKKEEEEAESTEVPK